MEESTVKNSSGRVFFKSRFLPADDCLYCEWHGYVNEIEPSKEACMKVVENIKDYQTIALLNDNRPQVGPWPKLDEWLGTVWIPAMAAAGLKFFAHIHSVSAFTQISAGNVLKQNIAGIEFMHFQDEAEAKAWLAERSKSAV